MDIALVTTDDNCISEIRTFLSERYPDICLTAASGESGMIRASVVLADVTQPLGFSCAERAVAEHHSIAVLIGDEASIA